MIPYEDLVNALTSWRARKGLPVAQTSNAWTAAAAAPTPPPAAPPRSAAAPVPPPLARPSEESLDVDEAALLEESHYENEGDDFAMAFGAAPSDGESTSIGGAPRPGGHQGHNDAFGGETLLGEHQPEHTHDEAVAEEDEDKNPIEW